MNPRERVLTALNHEKPDRVPRELSYGYGGFTPGAYAKFLDKTDSDSPEEYFNYEVRAVSYPLPNKRDESYYREIGTNIFDDEVDFNNEYEKEYLENMAISLGEWGIGIEPGGEGSKHFVNQIPPMEDYEDTKQVEEHPFPDYTTSENFEYLQEEVRAIHQKDLAAMGELYTTILETAESLRGMEKLFKDLYARRDFVSTLFEELTKLRCKQAKQYAAAGVDILRLGDDIGDQKGMLINPDIWRELLKPRLKKIIEVAKQEKEDLLVFYHSDGDCREVIPDLIEIGVDILNPVQPEVMDPARIKKQYGDRLAFWGTVGVQETLPFGSPEKVRETVRERIKTVGKGGGLLLAPTHIVDEEVSWENIMAFFEAIDEYGSYS